MCSLAGRASDLALHNTETRLARLINDLSHESLAEMIGSVRVVVNRQLQHWKQEGIVDAHRGHLEVEALQELMRRAEDIPRKVSV
ncbi:MAG: winged helix-turn-helix domain-containing protein [Gammaproteobacteria bacterium]|nr:winged helix-turn-helix domain-containing protein [Gammaproteobacteria bacterium]